MMAREFDPNEWMPLVLERLSKALEDELKSMGFEKVPYTEVGLKIMVDTMTRVCEKFAGPGYTLEIQSPTKEQKRLRMAPTVTLRILDPDATVINLSKKI